MKKINFHKKSLSLNVKHAGVLLVTLLLLVTSTVHGITYKIGTDGSGDEWSVNSHHLISTSLGTVYQVSETNLKQAIYSLNNTGGTVYLPSGDINLTTGITLTHVHDDVAIIGTGRGTNINVQADIIAFNLTSTQSVTLSNMKITTYSSSTKPMIQLFTNGRASVRNIIENINIYNSDWKNHNYTGIELYVKLNPILENTFNTITINNGCGYGINFKITGGTAIDYINCNSFTEIDIWRPYHCGINLNQSGNGGTSSIGANIFSNILVQAANFTQYGINVTGGGNSFNDVYVMDWYVAEAGIGVYEWLLDSNHGNTYIRTSDNGIPYTDRLINLGGNLRYDGANIFMSRYKYLRVVSNSNVADYDSLYEALEDIENNASHSPSATNRYMIHVYGNVTETKPLTAYSYIDVVGFNAVVYISNPGTHGVTFSNDHTVWRNLKIVLAGATGGKAVIYCDSVDDTVQLIDCECINEATSATNYNRGVLVSGGNPKFIDCYIKSSDTHAYGEAMRMISGCTSTLVNVIAEGGAGGVGSDGFNIRDTSNVTLLNCEGIVNSATSYGVMTQATTSNSGSILIKTTNTTKFYNVIQLHPLATEPAVPSEGMLYCNNSDNHLYFYNGSAWLQLDN